MAGELLRLCVSTDARKFRVRFYRHGASEEQRCSACDDRLTGELAPSRPADVDWCWPPYDIEVPSCWRSGVYTACFEEDEHAANQMGRRKLAEFASNRTLFVVTPAAAPSARMLYKLPLFTYHAYNIADSAFAQREAGRRAALTPPMPDDGQCLYSSARAVTWRRPGGGVGGLPWDSFNFDPYDSTSPRQTFAHWDQPFVAWLESRGYAADFCTDLDLHAGRIDLRRYPLLISAGHDEYWTDAMRERTERFVDAGGNVAFFGANTCYFRVAVDEVEHTISRGGQWDSHRNDLSGTLSPENVMTGVSYRNGGGKWRGERPPTGFRVQNSAHWAYAGTGLDDGDIFGASQRLIGYECDGAHFDRRAKNGRVHADGTDGTPADFEILGVGDIRAWDVSDGSGEINGNGAATLGVHRPGGTVFTASTVDWPRVVAHGGESATATITCNVLAKLSAG